jgi:hypothetical protein
MLRLLPGEFDLRAESGGVVKAMFENALMSEHRRRTQGPGGFVDQGPIEPIVVELPDWEEKP